MKTVLITGIGKGIGKALADKFLAEGWFVLGTSTNGTAPMQHNNLSMFQLDLTLSGSIAECARSVEGTGKEVDILVNNAGVLLDDEETDIIIEKLRGTLEVNLIGTVDFTERIIPFTNADGHIVNISSQAGSLADIENFTHSHAPLRYPAYKISKAALNMYTRTLALSLKHEGKGIIVSSVHPGWVRTEMGGDEADISPEESAEAIYRFAVSKPETGQFWFKGEKMPW